MYNKSLEYNSNTQVLIGTKKKTLIDQENGVYQVSPLIMMKGSEHKKQLLLNYYCDNTEED